MQRQDIVNNFTYHPPTTDEKAMYGVIRAHALNLALLISDNTPDSPEQTIALRKLEECVMYANAAIARNAPTGTPKWRANQLHPQKDPFFLIETDDGIARADIKPQEPQKNPFFVDPPTDSNPV